jgi:hypothetical protein
MKNLNTQLYQAFNLIHGGNMDLTEQKYKQTIDKQDPVTHVHRGPGRRPNAEKYMQRLENGGLDGNQLNLPQSKFPSTIDIKFDNKNPETKIKDKALDKY